MPQHDAPGKQGNAVKQPPTRSALKLLHERREVRDFPMLRELSVVDSVKLKGHRVDPSSSGFEANEFDFVRAADGVQNGDTVALGDDRRNRQLQIRKGRTKVAPAPSVPSNVIGASLFAKRARSPFTRRSPAVRAPLPTATQGIR